MNRIGVAITQVKIQTANLRAEKRKLDESTGREVVAGSSKLPVSLVGRMIDWNTW